MPYAAADTDRPAAQLARLAPMSMPTVTVADMMARAREVAEDLRGTAESLTAFATEDEINDSIFCAELDLLVFECRVCGWWHDESEEDDEETCQECSE